MDLKILVELIRPLAGAHPEGAPAENKVIADAVHLSEDSVRARLTRIYAALGLASAPKGAKRNRLAKIALEQGLHAGWRPDGLRDTPSPALGSIERSELRASSGANEDAGAEDVRGAAGTPTSDRSESVPTHRIATGSGDGSDVADGGDANHRGRRGVLGIALGLLVAAAAVAGFALLGDDDEVGAPVATGDNARVRVLFLIDVSGSMRRALDPDARKPDGFCAGDVDGPARSRGPSSPPRARCRIEFAREFVASGIRRSPGFVRVGVWLVTSSAQGLPKKCRWVPRTHCELQPLGAAHQAGDLAERVNSASVKANRGGTPLYEAIGRASDTVLGDDDGGSAIDAVVVITDGGDHTGTAESVEDPLVTHESEKVKVLITGIDEGVCHQIQGAIKKHYPSSKCYSAGTAKEAAAARKAIGRELPRPLPSPR